MAKLALVEGETTVVFWGYSTFAWGSITGGLFSVNLEKKNTKIFLHSQPWWHKVLQIGEQTLTFPYKDTKMTYNTITLCIEKYFSSTIQSILSRLVLRLLSSLF